MPPMRSARDRRLWITRLRAGRVGNREICAQAIRHQPTSSSQSRRPLPGGPRGDLRSPPYRDQPARALQALPPARDDRDPLPRLGAVLAGGSARRNQVEPPLAFAVAAHRAGAVQSTLAHAQLAQLVEHFHGKEGVSGSSPELGSQEKACKAALIGPAEPKGTWGNCPPRVLRGHTIRSVPSRERRGS